MTIAQRGVGEILISKFQLLHAALYISQSKIFAIFSGRRTLNRELDNLYRTGFAATFRLRIVDSLNFSSR